DALVSRGAPTAARHGAAADPSGRAVVSFADFEDSPPPGLTARDIHGALGSARGLRLKGGGSDMESPIDFDAKELVAAALMLTVFGAAHYTPTTDSAPTSGAAGAGWAGLDYTASGVF